MFCTYNAACTALVTINAPHGDYMGHPHAPLCYINGHESNMRQRHLAAEIAELIVIVIYSHSVDPYRITKSIGIWK